MIEKGVAFLVGIDEYQDERLKNFGGDATPTEDVRDVMEWLELNHSQYKVLPQFTLTKQPITCEILDQKLEELLTQPAYKNVLIYFSGHGYQILDGDTKKQKRYKGYLGTYDSELLLNKNGELDQQRYGLSFERLSELIGDAKHLNNLVLWIDACHSGFAIQYEVLRSALSRLSPSFSYCILASSLSSEESYSGVFTSTLVERLKNKAFGAITADVISKYVREKLNNSLRGDKMV
ncbi:hypothetical protein H6G76_18815 [Nostoc sp. FACHB-152]|uniref:caspase family protein n=1 Tax=Nostoc sp. FACHB-152 TaxID=2692837 RepID=UPI00168567FB|nr:caspase family protein [Nostoc sp. FACHB-152]MBD2449169.1 hypothetical protein [Nostoc sp. FACHB-152]